MHDAVPRGSRFAGIALVLACGLALGAAAAAGDDAEALAKFRKYVTSPGADSRAAVVRSLEGIDRPEAAGLLIPVLGDEAWQVRSAALEILSGYRSEATVTVLEEAARGKLPPRVRSLLLLALGRIGRGSSLEVLAAASGDRDWSVRRAAAEALGALGPPALSTGALQALLGDKEVAVRTTAADSLGRIGDPAGAGPLIEALGDEHWQVQAASAASLAAIRDPRAVAPLIELMRRGGRLRQDAADALEAVTTMRFGIDPDRWAEWWQANRDGFEAPESPAPSRPAPSSPRAAPRKYAPSFARYYGIPTPSERILFLLDVSRSMAEEIEISRPERLGDRRFSSNVKMEIAKEELIRTIDDIGSNVYFNIIVYHTTVDSWKTKLQAATNASKRAARAFIRRQKPRGTERRATKSRGRPGARPQRTAGKEVSEAGRTNIYDALARAFAISGVGTYDRHYDTAVDTLFLLSDGEPTAGTLVKPPEIRAEITRLNKLRRVVIHTINFGKSPAGAGLLRDLARDSGGTYVDLVGETPFPGGRPR